MKHAPPPARPAYVRSAERACGAPFNRRLMREESVPNLVTITVINTVERSDPERKHRVSVVCTPHRILQEKIH